MFHTWTLVDRVEPHVPKISSNVILHVLVILIVWEIWQERNSCTFRHKIASMPEVLAKIRYNMELWQLAGVKCFEYPFGAMVVRN